MTKVKGEEIKQGENLVFACTLYFFKIIFGGFWMGIHGIHVFPSEHIPGKHFLYISEIAEADTGMIGGSQSHEFHLKCPGVGEDIVYTCNRK